MLQFQLRLAPHLPWIESVLPPCVEVNIAHEARSHCVYRLCRDGVLYHGTEVELFEDIDKDCAELYP